MAIEIIVRGETAAEAIGGIMELARMTGNTEGAIRETGALVQHRDETDADFKVRVRATLTPEPLDSVEIDNPVEIPVNVNVTVSDPDGAALSALQDTPPVDVPVPASTVAPPPPEVDHLADVPEQLQYSADSELDALPDTIAPDVELDSEGLPWDARIHTSAKTKIKSNDTWKLKRGTDPALVATVKSELTELMLVPVPAPATATTGSAADVEPTGSATTPPPPPVDDDAPKTFPEFTERFLELGVTTVQVTKILKDNGVAGFPMLSARLDLIPAVWEALKKCSTQ